MAKNRKIGRPSIYHAELAKDICNKIASNSKSIKKLCSENSHWPNQDTIFVWLKNHPDFADQYARAKRAQIEPLIDEILEIADDTANDVLVNENGNTICNNEHIARSRLRIDTRKWLASKLVPKVYGNNTKHGNSFDAELDEEVRLLRNSLNEKYKREY